MLMNDPVTSTSSGEITPDVAITTNAIAKNDGTSFGGTSAPTKQQGSIATGKCLFFPIDATGSTSPECSYIRDDHRLNETRPRSAPVGQLADRRQSAPNSPTPTPETIVAIESAMMRTS